MPDTPRHPRHPGVILDPIGDPGIHWNLTPINFLEWLYIHKIAFLRVLPMHFPAPLIQLLKAASYTQNERMVVRALLDGTLRARRARRLTGATT